MNEPEIVVNPRGGGSLGAGGGGGGSFGGGGRPPSGDESKGSGMHAVITVLLTVLGIGAGFYLGQKFNQDYQQLNDDKLRRYYAKECYETLDRNTSKLEQAIGNIKIPKPASPVAKIDETKLLAAVKEQRDAANSDLLEAIKTVKLEVAQSVGASEQNLKKAIEKLEAEAKKTTAAAEKAAKAGGSSSSGGSVAEKRLITLLNELDDNKIQLVSCPKPQ